MQEDKSSFGLLELIRESDSQSALLTVDPSTAKDWLVQARFERQRPLRQTQVQKLVLLMDKGEFKRSEIKFAYFNGRYYLINGQHRLTAVVHRDKPITFTVTIVAVNSEEDLNQTYAAEDRGLSRSLMDTQNAFGLSEELGVPPSTVRPFSAATAFISWDLQPGNIYRARAGTTDYRRVELLREWAKEIKEFQEIAPRGSGTKTRGTMWVFGPLAIELLTLRYQNTKAREFWTTIANQEGMVRGTPEYALFQYCQYRTGVKALGDQDVMTRAFTLAWNAYYRHQGITVVRPKTMKPGPYEIAGTPYNGKQWGPDPKWWSSRENLPEVQEA